MRFAWDIEKNRQNLAKHKVSFETASRIFGDPRQVSFRDDLSEEERWLTLGLLDGAVVLLVVHTMQEGGDEETIRIISARKATKKEREKYEHPYGE
jgi:uncharacterized protein